MSFRYIVRCILRAGGGGPCTIIFPSVTVHQSNSASAEFQELKNACADRIQLHEVPHRHEMHARNY